MLLVQMWKKSVVANLQFCRSLIFFRQLGRHLECTGRIILVHDDFNELHLPCVGELGIIQKFLQSVLVANSIRPGQGAVHIPKGRKK